MLSSMIELSIHLRQIIQNYYRIIISGKNNRNLA